MTRTFAAGYSRGYQDCLLDLAGAVTAHTKPTNQATAEPGPTTTSKEQP